MIDLKSFFPDSFHVNFVYSIERGLFLIFGLNLVITFLRMQWRFANCEHVIKDIRLCWLRFIHNP